jgi:hypothetical protein
MRFLMIWLFLGTVLTSTSESQIVRTPGLPELENSEPVNPTSTEKVQPGSSVSRGIFHDSLVRDKTFNSVYSDLKILTEFTALKTAPEKKVFTEKYTTDRVKKLVESAGILAPAQAEKYAITDSDKKQIEEFATQISEGTYQVGALPAPFDIRGQLGPLLAFLSSQAEIFPASMTNEEQIKQLSQAGMTWLADQKVIDPRKLSPNEGKVMDDLSMLILSKKWASESKESKATDVASVINPNRVEEHQPTITDFLKTLPQTLINRNGAQNFDQVRDQVLDIAIRAFQQKILGTQALSDEERQQLVKIVDNTMKPFENMLGRIFHLNQRPIIAPTMQPVLQQPLPLQPVFQPFTGFYGGSMRGHVHHGHKFRSY